MAASADATAAAYVEADVDDDAVWGVGLHPSIVTASLRAVVNAVDRRDRDSRGSAVAAGGAVRRAVGPPAATSRVRAGEARQLGGLVEAERQQHEREDERQPDRDRQRADLAAERPSARRRRAASVSTRRHWYGTG